MVLQWHNAIIKKLSGLREKPTILKMLKKFSRDTTV